MRISQDAFLKIDAIRKRTLSPFRPHILEKDILVTEAIRLIAANKLPGLSPVFCGGTSLSKGYHAIDRMSEDIDFKLVFTAKEQEASKSHRRKMLKAIKDNILNLLTEEGFGNIDIRARNENTYFRFNVPYESVFGEETALRPYLKIEFINMPTQLPPRWLTINTMSNEILDINDGAFTIPCQAIEEILIEKVLAILRRLSDDRAYYSENPYLMRHIYDISQIVQKGTDQTVDLAELFGNKIGIESDMFENHCVEFAESPYDCLSESLKKLQEESKYRTDYNNQIFEMLAVKEGHDFDSAMKLFVPIADELVESLRDTRGPH